MNDIDRAVDAIVGYQQARNRSHDAEPTDSDAQWIMEQVHYTKGYMNGILHGLTNEQHLAAIRAVEQRLVELNARNRVLDREAGSLS